VIRSAVEGIAPFAEEQGIPLDEDTIDRLSVVVALLEVWNRKTRLTGDRDLGSLVSKHCADSLVAASELPAGACTMDVGSGAGFPGLVAACARPDVDLTLVDARQKSCSFLDAAAARASLNNVRVLNTRVEYLARTAGELGGYGTIVSRGVDLTSVLPELRSLLSPSGSILMMLSRRQISQGLATRAAGFRMTGDRRYRLPTGELRCIARYEPT